MCQLSLPRNLLCYTPLWCVALRSQLYFWQILSKIIWCFNIVCSQTLTRSLNWCLVHMHRMSKWPTGSLAVKWTEQGRMRQMTLRFLSCRVSETLGCGYSGSASSLPWDTTGPCMLGCLAASLTSTHRTLGAPRTLAVAIKNVSRHFQVERHQSSVTKWNSTFHEPGLG